MNELATSPLDRLVQWDDRRPSLPGEHWIAAALGFYLLARPRRTVAGRLATASVGALLITRALSGRDGAIAVLQRRSGADTEVPDFIDVAAPWPYHRRVRITAPRRVRASAATRRPDEQESVPKPA